MTLIVILIGMALIVAAIRNSQQSLFSALITDVPEFVVWAAAIFAIGAIGYIPDMKPVARGLLGLVLVVIILRNFNGIAAGFADAWQNPPAASPAPGSAETVSQAPTSSLLGQGFDSAAGSFGQTVGSGIGGQAIVA